MRQSLQEKIKELTDHKIWLAPLAGYTNQPFRRICKQCGADVLVSEMVSADGIVYEGVKSLNLAGFSDEERPFGIQLFGTKPNIMMRSAEIIIKLQPDFIDINMGCPVKKVVTAGAGSALMKDPGLAVEIVQEVKNKTEFAGIPLSVKIRSGWDLNNLNYISFAEKLVLAGVDFLIFHPRSRSQMFEGKSSWSQIKELKEAIDVPIVGNGDIQDADDALRMMEETKCDSIMVGRGALGKPWIFNEIRSVLNGRAFESLGNIEKMQLIQKHFCYVIEDEQVSRRRAILEMRSHFCFYTKGIPGGSKVRNIINHTEDDLEIMNTINTLFDDLE